MGDCLLFRRLLLPESTVVTARKDQTPCHIFQEKDTYRGHTFQNSKKCRQGKVHPVFFCSQFSIFQTELKFLLPYW